VLDEPAADPLAQLRAMAARSGDALRTPVQELGVTTLSWGPALDVRLDDDDATVLLRFTIAGERLYVLEGDLLPELAADPNSRARAAYDRMVETFRPLA
jgi:hypothetical protein